MKKIISLAAFLGVVLSAAPALAMPPYPDLDLKIKSGEIVIPDHSREVVTGDKIADQAAQFDMAAYINKLRQTKADSLKPFNLLVLMADFSDKPGIVKPDFFDSLVFSDQANSVRNFYRKNSYYTIDLVSLNNPITIGWVRLPQTYAYYANGSYGMGAYPNNSQKLFEDLINIVDPAVDFSKYDNDGNGYVDGVVVIHAGRGAELTGNISDIWSHKWGLFGAKRKDNIWVQNYSIQPEYWNTTGDMTIGVYAHEIAHLFGLPDLYDTDNGSKGIGKWSLMSGGSWNGTLGSSPAYFDAWSKARIGFVAPGILSGSASSWVLPPSENSPAGIMKYPIPGVDPKEYFMVENRQKIEGDTGLPAYGLLVWHVDETKTNNTKEWYPGKTTLGNYLVALEQSDGLWELEKNLNGGNAGDVFPGSGNKTSFGANTVPDSKTYAGVDSGLSINNIAIAGSNVIFDLGLGGPTAGPDVTPPTVTLTQPETSSVFVNQAKLIALATDNKEVSRVEFYLDGSNFIGSDTIAPYEAVWNAAGASLGEHVLTSKAVDGAGNAQISNPVVVKRVVCGDLNGDKVPDVFDVSALINYINRNGPAFNPPALADVNWDGKASADDITALSDYVFGGSVQPASCSQLVSPNQQIQTPTRLVSPTSPISSQSTLIAIGDTVKTTALLRIRENPSLKAKTLKIAYPRTTAKVLEGPVQADGYEWWKLAYRTVTGWSTGKYLQKVPTTGFIDESEDSGLAAILSVLESAKNQLFQMISQVDNLAR